MARDKRRASTLPDEPGSEQAPVPQEPAMTVEAFARGATSPTMKAFVHVERLRPRRKLGQTVWEAAYQAFLKEPR